MLLAVGAPAPQTQPLTSRGELPAPVDLPALEAEAYFAGGPFAPARRLVSRGANAKAVALLKRLLQQYPRAEERPQARYLLGLSLIRTGEYAEAAALFDDLRSTYPELRDDHTYYRGQALYLWGSYLDAATALETVDPEGPWAEPARRLRAWALLKATDYGRLVPWLENEEAVELDDELTFILAAGRVRRRDRLGSYRAYTKVWRTSERPDLAGRALAEMATLKVGDRWLMSPQAARAVRAEKEGLSAPSRFTATLQRLDQRLSKVKDGQPLRAEIAWALGRVAEGKKRLTSAVKWYRLATRRAGAKAVALRAGAGLALGRVLEDLDREGESLRAYREVAEAFPDRPEAEQALFRAADLQLRARRYADAKSACQRLLVSNPVSEYRRRCLWNVAWAEYRMGRFAQARQFLSSLARGPLPADLDAATRYWLGRTEADLGRPDQARVQWKQVLDRHPLDYYAALAERQLAEFPGRMPSAPVAGSQELSARLLKALEYQRLGLRERALDEAATYEREVQESLDRPSAAEYRALAQLYDALRERREARRVREEAARAYAVGPGVEEFLAAARRAHPLKFEAEIRKAAKEFNLPPSLLFALVRTESGFRPDAVSAMDAYGLAQLILPTARKVSRRIKAGKVTRHRLLDEPSFNVRLGAAYLRELLDLYDGREPFAIAAYNAGPAAVDAWRRRRVRRLSGVKGAGIGLGPSADEFGEEIPVEETQRFVKAVLSRARAYAVLYPSPAVRAERPPPSAPQAAEAVALIEPEHLPEAPRPRYALPAGVHLWLEDALAAPATRSAHGWPAGADRE